MAPGFTIPDPDFTPMSASSSCPPIAHPGADSELQYAVAAKVEEALAIPSGIRLARDGEPLPADERRQLLTLAFTQMARATSIAHLSTTPADLLENFAVIALQRNHSIEGELVQMIRLFLMAYADPATTHEATRLMGEMEAVLQKVISQRGPSFSAPFLPMPGTAAGPVTTH
jgi:hypothetical protein